MKKKHKNRQLLHKTFSDSHNASSPPQQGFAPADLLSKAVVSYRAGNLHDVETICRNLLASHPKHVDVLNLLGIVYAQQGKWEEGIRLMDKAIAIHPNYAEAYNNRGIALYNLQRYNDAVASYDKAIALNPNYAEAYNNRGIALYNLQRYSDALVNYDKTLALNPNYAEVYNNRGLLLSRLKRYDYAAASYNTALTLNPNYAEAYCNRGLLLYRMKRYSDAVVDCDKAIAINPNYAEAYNNRGIALYRLKRNSDALTSYNKALALNPNYAEAYNNRGLLLFSQKQYNEALANYDKALTINSNYAEAYWNKGGLKLLSGQYEEGWKLYEWRWKKKDANITRIFQKPLWLGEEDLAGKTILLHAEQGFGDTIQFCRYAPIIESLGAKVILEIPKPLTALLSTLKGSFNIVEQGSELTEFDFHCPLMSLPLAFKTTLSNIPAAIPYLSTDQENLKVWQKRLGEKSKPRIGLIWSGSITHENDSNRSIPLSMLAPFLQYDFEYHSIQKEMRAEDAEFLAKSKIIPHEKNLHDFLDAASLVSEMDIIISVDTSVAHLAGALGKKLWLLLPFLPDYRWMAEREDSPWYPSARLFRQSHIYDWSYVIVRVNAELAVLAAKTVE